MKIGMINNIQFTSKHKFESRAQKLFAKLAKEGKITNVSKKGSTNLDNEMDIAFNEITDKYERRILEQNAEIKALGL